MNDKHVALVFFMLIVLVGCSGTSISVTPEPTNLKKNATSTAIPPSGSPEPTSCQDIDWNCLELYFDGENCTSEGQSVYKQGKFTLIFFQ